MPGPDTVRVDMWPDLSEYSAKERYSTEFRHADGSVAEVFSSFNRSTVVRHFRWMEEHGIDGVLEVSGVFEKEEGLSAGGWREVVWVRVLVEAGEGMELRPGEKSGWKKRLKKRRVFGVVQRWSSKLFSSLD